MRVGSCALSCSRLQPCAHPYDWWRQVHSVFSARECVKAHELMDSGEFTGKIVLSWSDE